jgi:hypothetical protein
MDTKTTKALKPIEIFRPGTFVAADGTKHTFTAAQLREMVDAYNPEFSDAPLVVGHPKTDDPRYGRAASLFINDAGIVCATPDEVCPEFAEAVHNKHYKNISASIYLPTAPGNPMPGKHYLRHIGFLGGAAPSVRGLRSVEFATALEGVVEFSYEDRVIVGMLRNLRDWFVETVGIEKAQAIIPDYSLDTLQSSAIQEDLEEQSEMNGGVTAFSAPNNPQENVLKIEEKQKELNDREAALNARAAEIAKQEAQTKKAGHADFAEALCVEGKLLPVQKAAVVEIMSQLDTANLVADFAQGDANHGKTGADLFKAFLSTQPKQVEFNRISNTAGTDAGTADFAAPPGTEVDPVQHEVYRQAVAYQHDHPDVDFMTAAKIVAKK